ncbi:hypothetical protein B0H15DRAFT_784543 [Mycena belliarum]|uniref:Uncharacterized protein n=1 Tax=Mycena belliarum TaxID=1033014 RepID=A0AAD6XK24_9AGAR|nr:hypothetical protein B0H15DRAFT_784543 [Mycena belliae]
MALSEEPNDGPTPFQRYAAYPFSSDEEYQNGLASIIAGGALDNDPPDDIREEILRRTRVFYFNRVAGTAITMDAAREYELAQAGAGAPTPPSGVLAPPVSSGSGDDPEPVVLSFAQLQALIEAGKADQIPNNKFIPEELNEAPPSTSAAPARKKPWETDSEYAVATQGA